MGKIPSKIYHVDISNQLFEKTIQKFQKAGLESKENIAYWTGELNGNNAEISKVIFAEDYPEFENSQYSAKVSLQSSFMIAEQIHKSNGILVAQIHSHPAEAFHSWIDNERPISHRKGLLSIVVPYFAREIQDFSKCKIYEYLGSGKWYELTNDEMQNRFNIMENK